MGRGQEGLPGILQAGEKQDFVVRNQATPGLFACPGTLPRMEKPTWEAVGVVPRPLLELYLPPPRCPQPAVKAPDRFQMPAWKSLAEG